METYSRSIAHSNEQNVAAVVGVHNELGLRVLLPTEGAIGVRRLLVKMRAERCVSSTRLERKHAIGCEHARRGGAGGVFEAREHSPPRVQGSRVRVVAVFAPGRE
jgi:hypothetical protein